MRMLVLGCFGVLFTAPALAIEPGPQIASVAKPAEDLADGIPLDLDWFCPQAEQKNIWKGERGPSLVEGECRLQVNEHTGRFHSIHVVPMKHELRSKFNDTVLDTAKTDALSRLSDIGVPEEQIGTVEARFVNFTTSDEPDVEYTIGVKVWVQREYRGVELGGHRAIFSYSINGEVQEARATWPRVSANLSNWELPGTGPCSTTGVELWLDEEFDRTSEQSISKMTTFVPRAIEGGEGTVAVDLKWVVFVNDGSEVESGRTKSLVCGERNE